MISKLLKAREPQETCMTLEMDMGLVHNCFVRQASSLTEETIVN